MKKYIFLFFIIFSCDYSKNNEERFIARVGNYYLTKSEVYDQVPKNLSKVDSNKLVKNIIEKWALNKLLMQNAELNMTDLEKKNIDNISNAYKENLIINKYKNKISYNNPDTLIKDDEVVNFYTKNSNNFKLYDEIIKGRYVKLNKNNFNINEIKRRFNRFNVSDKVFFDSISIQLLNHYLKDSVWINKTLFFNKIPKLKKNEIQRIVKNSLFYIKEDSLALYLIKINNYKKADDYAPLDYIYNRIKELISNKKKINYLNKVDKELIDEAINKNVFEIYE